MFDAGVAIVDPGHRPRPADRGLQPPAGPAPARALAAASRARTAARCASPRSRSWSSPSSPRWSRSARGVPGDDHVLVPGSGQRRRRLAAQRRRVADERAQGRDHVTRSSTRSQTVLTTGPVLARRSASSAAFACSSAGSGRRSSPAWRCSASSRWASGSTRWRRSMQVLVATLVTFAIGLALGIASARSDRFASVPAARCSTSPRPCPRSSTCCPPSSSSRPRRFTAIFAAVIFALPPVIRLVDVGIRAVPHDDHRGRDLVGRRSAASS